MNKGKRAVVEKCLIKVVFQDSWQKEKASWEIRYFLTPTLCHTRGIKSSLMRQHGRTLDLTLYLQSMKIFCHQWKYFAFVAELRTKYFTIVARLRLKILDFKCRRKLRLSLSASVAKWRLLARVQLSDLRQDMSEHLLERLAWLVVCVLSIL